MAKLKVNIYWDGVYCPSGSEAPKGVPARFTEGDMKGEAAENARKVSTKEKKIKEEDKNAAPKKRTTKKK